MSDKGEPTLLTTIVQMNPLFIYFDVAERDLIEYQRSDQEQTPLPSASSKKLPVEIAIATEEGYPHTGYINFLENRVNTGTGTVTVRGTVENPTLEGQSARQRSRSVCQVRVPIGPEKMMTVIPEQALITGQDGQSVYVLDKENKLVRRAVTVIDQAVYKARTEEQKKNPAWMLSAPSELPKGLPEQKPMPLLSVVAISKGLETGDQVLVTGLATARPAHPSNRCCGKLKRPTRSHARSKWSGLRSHARSKWSCMRSHARSKWFSRPLTACVAPLELFYNIPTSISLLHDTSFLY